MGGKGITQRPTRRLDRRRLLVIALAAASAPAAANDGDQGSHVVPPPEALTQGEPVDTRVTIRHWSEGAIVEKYRASGRVYAMRIEPSVYPAYYHYNANDDGVLDARYDALHAILNTAQWRLFSW